jgi:hypothetical protein
MDLNDNLSLRDAVYTLTIVTVLSAIGLAVGVWLIG